MSNLMMELYTHGRLEKTGIEGFIHLLESCNAGKANPCALYLTARNDGLRSEFTSRWMTMRWGKGGISGR